MVCTSRCRRWWEKGIVQLIFSGLACSAGREAEADTTPEAGVETKLMWGQSWWRAGRDADDRCHLHQSPPHRLHPEKRGAAPRLMGRTRGSLTSKRLVLWDGKGRPVRLLLSEGPCSDFTSALYLYWKMRLQPNHLNREHC